MVDLTIRKSIILFDVSSVVGPGGGQRAFYDRKSSVGMSSVV